FVISRFVLVRYPSVVAFVLLFNVLLVDLVSSQLRSALALSIAMILYHRGGHFFRGAALLVVTLIHTASILIMPVLWYAQRVVQVLKAKSSVFIFAAIITPVLLGAVLIGPFRESILGAIGDRRAEYIGDTVGIKFISIWILYLTVVMC